jgi:hypothetical protein
MKKILISLQPVRGCQALQISRHRRFNLDPAQATDSGSSFVFEHWI